MILLALALASGCGGPRRVPGGVTPDGPPPSGVLHFYPGPARGNEHRVDCPSPVRAGKYNLLTQAIRDP